MTFGTKVYRQPGGSEFTIGAGGSLNFEVGGKLGGTLSHGAGSEIYDSGALATYQEGASFTFNTGVSGTAFRFAGQGASTPSIGWGPNVPTHTAPMGSLYIRANGSVSNIYQNTTQDAAGSTWTLNGTASG